MRLRVLVDDCPKFDSNLRRTDRVCIGKCPAEVCGDAAGHQHVSAAPKDDRLSRLAALVAARAGGGWRIEVANLNHADVQTWGQAPHRVERGGVVAVTARNTAMWLRGAPAHSYLMLCEPDQTEAGQITRDRKVTKRSEADQLSEKEIEAIRMVFAEHLSSPPLRSPSPIPKKAAANRLKISESSLNDRLANALEKAKRVGYLPPGRQQAPITDANWVYWLVGIEALTFQAHARRVD